MKSILFMLKFKILGEILLLYLVDNFRIKLDLTSSLHPFFSGHNGNYIFF